MRTFAKKYLNHALLVSLTKDREGDAVSDLDQRGDCIFMKCLLKSKYSDLVLLCVVAFAFIALILFSAVLV